MKRSFTALCVLVLTLVLAGCGSRPQPTLAVSLEQTGTNLVVHLTTTNFVIGRDGHAHIRLNGGPETMPGTAVYTFTNVPPGHYVVDVDLSDVNHSNINVAQRAEIEMR